MTRDWSYAEVLKLVFPLLTGPDLTSCSLVSRQWRSIATDDYLWKRICTQKFPAICNKPPPSLTYRKLFLNFSKPHRPSLLPPNLSFTDLDFYFDIWRGETVIFSKSVSGSALQSGINIESREISDALRARLENPDYKMMVQVEPRFSIPSSGSSISVSVLVCRKDTHRIACILDRAVFDYVDRTALRALAYDYLVFSPSHPFVSGIRAWVSLLLVSNGEDDVNDVFGIEIDFCDAASSETEVLWLLDILDWK